MDAMLSLAPSGMLARAARNKPLLKECRRRLPEMPTNNVISKLPIARGPYEGVRAIPTDILAAADPSRHNRPPRHKRLSRNSTAYHRVIGTRGQHPRAR